MFDSTSKENTENYLHGSIGGWIVPQAKKQPQRLSTP